MKNTYPMIQTDTQLLNIPRSLECVVIRNYPTKYNKALKTFKEWLNALPHITKYCTFKYDKYAKHTELSQWNLNNVKPENIYVFPEYNRESYYLLQMLYSMRNSNDVIRKYVICPTFYIKSKKNLEYYSALGNLLIDKNNLEYI